MSVRLKTSLGTAMIQDIPFGNIPQSEYPGHPAVGREIRAWPRTRVLTCIHTHTHLHTRARARTLHIHTACFLRSPSPEGRVSFSLKSRRSPRKPRLSKAPGARDPSCSQPMGAVERLERG